MPNASWPGLSRPSTSLGWPHPKTWMPGTRLGMTWRGHARSLRLPRNPRSRRARARPVRAPARADRACDDARPAGRSISPASIRNRSPAARRSRSCRCCASPRCSACRRKRRRSAASTSRRPARRSGCSCRPGRSSSPRATARIYNGARALFAAGIRAGDIVHNCFSYHLTPGAFMLEAGAHALGCAVIPGGVGNTEAQLDAIAQLQAHAPMSARRTS